MKFPAEMAMFFTDVGISSLYMNFMPSQSSFVF